MSIHEKLRSLLLQAGLSESEAIVYAELLIKPATTKWEMVSRTGLNQNQIYRAFETLNNLKMINRNREGIKAMSLKALIAELQRSRRNTGKLAMKLKKISPFLHCPNESIEEFEIAYTQDQILEKYIFMAETNYNTCLDFGDLEKFVDILGGLDPVFKFREQRYKQSAKNIAICTTLGPNTACMARKQDMSRFASTIKQLNINFKNKWLIFSDISDYVMFNDFADKENPTSVTVKSKTIADIQRMQFNQFYQNSEKS